MIPEAPRCCPSRKSFSCCLPPPSISCERVPAVSTLFVLGADRGSARPDRTCSHRGKGAGAGATVDGGDQGASTPPQGSKAVLVLFKIFLWLVFTCFHVFTMVISPSGSFWGISGFLTVCKSVRGLKVYIYIYTKASVDIPIIPK